MRQPTLMFVLAVVAAGGCASPAADTDGGGGAGTGSGGRGGASSGGGGAAGATGGAVGTGAGGSGGGGVAGSGGGAGAGGRGGSGGTTSGTAGAGGGGGSGGGAGRGGSGGSGTGGAGGQGNAPGNALSVFPPANGTNICGDPQLRITFSGPPTIGTAGTIRVLNAGGAVVASVDVAAATLTSTNGGMTFNIQRPIYVDGNTAIVYLPSKPLAYGQTYYVNVEAGAISAPGGAAFTVTGTTAWRFTTAASAPASSTAIAVALDGSAPFCSLQGALDFIPANNTAATTVSLASGTYHEIVYFKSKSNVTIQGASQNGTVIEGTNNNNMNPSTKGRALVGGDGTNGLTVANLTIINQTAQGGSQAEALRLESCDKCVVKNATVISRQDTLLWSGRLYAKNVLVEGNVDFVWGTGAAYFSTSEIRTITRSGPIVQARNPASTYGYVFVDSKITAEAGLTGGVLARIDVGTYPASHVAYVNCQISTEISAAGWQLTAGTDTSMLRFWEYQSVDASGNPINVAGRLAGSVQLSASQAAMMRDPSVVLAGWTPPAN